MKMDQLYVGAGKADIHFEEALFPIDGFKGVHDVPSARVLLLKNGEQVAIVCLELVSLSPDGVRDVKKTVSELTNTKEENIWVHTTHVITTPHAPHAPRGMGGVELPISDEERSSLTFKKALYAHSLTAAVKAATEEAVASLCAAKMGVGTGTCGINVNRDIETPFGWWINFNPDGPSNHTVTVLCFDSIKGERIASFISYGLKPCAIDNSEMETGKRLVSSDVPGLACKLLEEQLGGYCLFAMSAAGDQVPLEQAWYDVVESDGTVRKVDLGVDAGLEIVARLGRRMADEIAPIIETTVCDQTAPVIQVSESGIDWPGKGRGMMVPTKNAYYAEKGVAHVDAMAMTIGDVALVGLKPEVNSPTEIQLQEASPYEHTLVVSMVNGGQKYMPDMASYEKCTWEAQSAPLMPGAAEAWVEEAVRILKDMHKKQ